MSIADTNVVLYLRDQGPKADRAEAIVGQGPRIRVQVLNETRVDCRCKAGLGWEQTEALRTAIKALCSVETLTVTTHEVGRALAERSTLSVCDAMIQAAAQIVACTVPWSEDMQDGLVVEGQ